MPPNASLPLLPEAAAERRLEAVGCTPLFGSMPFSCIGWGRMQHSGALLCSLAVAPLIWRFCWPGVATHPETRRIHQRDQLAIVLMRMSAGMLFA
jgi:hypothetical protein